MTQSTPPGWYPDGQGGQRWWDGNQWTEHTQPPPAPEASDRPAPSEPSAQPGPGDVTQVRPPAAPEQPGGDRPAAPEAGQPPAAAPTQIAGAPGAPQAPGYLGGPQQPGYPAQPGQPAWQGQQYGGGSSGGGISGKLIAIIGGAVGVLIILVILFVVVLGGGGGPKGTVEDYFSAIQDQDCDFIDLLSEDNKEFVDKDACEDDSGTYFDDGETCSDSDIEVKNEEEDGDEATVEYEVTGGGEDCEEKGSITLVKEDGDWKIDSFE